MTELSKKLTAFITAFSLVVVSFSATVHHHNHSDGHSCEHSLHVAVPTCHDHFDSTCNHSHDGHSHETLQSDQSDLAVSNTSQGNTLDHACLLCRFLAEHSADLTIVYSVSVSSAVVDVAALEIASPVLPVLFGYLLRGPPQA